jgi:hypothetical protein
MTDSPTLGGPVAGPGANFAAAGARIAGTAPDFALRDRGDVDDNWVHAEGESCAKCGADLTPRDYIRRSARGGWVHERCPVQTTVEERPSA